MLEALKFFLRTRPKIEALSEDNVRSENAVLRKKSKLIACPFQFNTLYSPERASFASSGHYFRLSFLEISSLT